MSGKGKAAAKGGKGKGGGGDKEESGGKPKTANHVKVRRIFNGDVSGVASVFGACLGKLVIHYVMIKSLFIIVG